MAQILPIRPFRYNQSLDKDIDCLVSPLFDVVSEKQRTRLYANPINSIHLSVPQGGAAAAKATLERWKSDGTIVQEQRAGIYVYYQYFKLAGSTREYCRKGFISHIRTYDWSERIILRHESTIPDAVNDRVELLEAIELHASPTHGLYTDPDFTLEHFMDDAMRSPIYETEDYQGVREVLAVIYDDEIIQQFIARISDKSVILADGHHRYEGSLQHMKKRRAANPAHSGNEGYNFHLMYLTNTESDDLRILPTHRLIHDIGLDEAEIMSCMEKYFHIAPIEDADTINEIITGKTWNFGLLFADNSYRVALRKEEFDTMSWSFPMQVKKLDLTVMHYFIIEKVLRIAGKQQRNSRSVSYDRSFSDCMKKVMKGEAILAIITNEVTIEDVKAVCASGYTMPQKSTYFYPKAIAGLLFSSIRDEEFTSTASNNPN